MSSWRRQYSLIEGIVSRCVALCLVLQSFQQLSEIFNMFYGFNIFNKTIFCLNRMELVSVFMSNDSDVESGTSLMGTSDSQRTGCNLGIVM